MKMRYTITVSFSVKVEAESNITAISEAMYIGPYQENARNVELRITRVEKIDEMKLKPEEAHAEELARDI